MWNAPPRFEVWTPVANAETRAKLGIPDSDTALKVRWINRDGAGGRQADTDGLREKDVIIAVAGKPLQMNTRQFNVHVKLNYKVGDNPPLTVLRVGQREVLKITLVE